MKRTKSITILLFICALIFSSLAACSGEKGGASSSVGTASRAESQSELFDNLPNKSYDNKEVVFLVVGDHAELYKSEEIVPNELSIDLINTSVEKRNALVEEKFGVVISEERTTSSTDMTTKIRLDNQSGDGTYDIVMPYIPDAATLASENALLQLNTDDLPINLNQSYWDQKSVEDMSINNRCYFVSGDISFLSFACTHALVFNKSVLDEYKLENPYELVENGDWTIDKMHEMAKAVTYTEADSWNDNLYGFLVNSNFITSMFIGAGQRLTSKDSQDLPTVVVGGTVSVTAFEAIKDFVLDASSSAYIETVLKVDNGRTVWQNATQAVADGNALFRAMALVDIPELGDYEVDFGILPAPKLNAEQPEYYANVSVLYAPAAAIPTNCKDKEMSAIILDAMCQASTETTKNAYYDVLLKQRRISDNESEAILDLLWESRVYDLGIVFQWGGINSFMDNAVSKGGEFASSYETIQSSIEAAMQKTVEAYQLN